MPDNRPLVVVSKIKNALSIVSADGIALSLGIHSGLALADARARVAELEVVEEDQAANRALLERLADWCDRYTPLVALDPPDGLALDITGCSHLFEGEAVLLSRLCEQISSFCFQVRGAVAGTPDAARAVCRYGNGGIVLPQSDAEAVRPLPVAALAISSDLAQALSRAGLKTIGDLADRPKTPLAARFGEALTRQLARTLGQEDVRITPRRSLPACIVERNFAEPIAHEDGVRATLTKLITSAAGILEERGEGGRSFEASFFRTDGAVRRIQIDTGMPSRDPSVIIRLFLERLDALADPIDPGFGFDLIQLAVASTEKLTPAQTTLDGREMNDEEVAAVADRLGARFGTESVLRFVAEDTHTPERAARAQPVATSTPKRNGWTTAKEGEPPARPLHLFNPPQRIETLAEVPDGPPLRFRWRRVLYEVARAEGPERIAPEWWRCSDDALTRDYYRIEDANGRRFWVFREGLYGRETLTPRWFLHGLFA